MANLQNIVVAEAGVKLVLFPVKKDAGKRIMLNEEQTAEVREFVQAYCATDARELPYHDRLSENKRVGLKGNNGMAATIRAIAKEGNAKPAVDQELEDAKAKVQADREQAKAAQINKRQAKKEAYQEPSIEELMVEAEARNAEMDAVVKPESMSERRFKAMLNEAKKHGIKLVTA